MDVSSETNGAHGDPCADFHLLHCHGDCPSPGGGRADSGGHAFVDCAANARAHSNAYVDGSPDAHSQRIGCSDAIGITQRCPTGPAANRPHPDAHGAWQLVSRALSVSASS